MKKDTSSIIVIGIIALVFFPILTNNCSHRKRQSGSFTYMEEGLDKVIKELRQEPDFTILLYDMNYKNNKYYHQYQTLVPTSDSTFKQDVSDWLEVSDPFFQKHVNDLGMELASKQNNVLEKETAPAGYSQYVGNERYGHWTQRNGSSFWEFYGRYAFMSSMFHLIARPAYRNYWGDYNSHYRGMGRTYYGPGGYYSTRQYASTAGKNTSWGKRPQSFKENVRSRVSRSSTKNSSSSNSRRTTRSGSRYSGSSSYRSRGGGFGGK
jgi:hypothetical protein